MKWIICEEDCRACPFAEHLQCPPGDRPQCEICAWAPVCPCTNPDRSPERAARLLAALRKQKGGKPGEKPVEMLVYLPPEMIQPPPFPLRVQIDRDKLAELAQSMQSNLGMVEPIVVRPAKGGKVQLVVGSRRLAAAKQARSKAIACRIKELSDRDALLFGLVENLQREDLTWAEEARALAKLQEVTGWSGREIARKIGKSCRWVNERLQAHGTLEEAAVESAEAEVIPAVSPQQPTLPLSSAPERVPLRAVTAVAKVSEPEKKRELLAEVIEEGLTEEETKARVAEVLGETQPGTIPVTRKPAPPPEQAEEPPAPIGKRTLEQLVEEGLVTKGPGAIPFTRAEVLYLCEVMIHLNVADFMHRHGRRCALLATDPVTGKTLTEQAMELVEAKPLEELKAVLLEEAGRVYHKFAPAHPAPRFDPATQSRVAWEEDNGNTHGV